MQSKIVVVFAALVCAAYCAQSGQSNRDKPGRCVPQITQQVCGQQCRKDSDCRGTAKCCSTTCGGAVCNEPMNNNAHRGSSNDNNRHRTTTTTKKPYTVPPSSVKPGTCPGPLAQFSCAAECQNDGNCRGDQKCCPTTCGGAMCKPPASATTTTTRRPPGARPGECPSAAPRQSGAPTCRNQCERDRDCRNSAHKCCLNSCNARECVAPVFN